MATAAPKDASAPTGRSALAETDELVWARVLALLEDPALIQAEIDRRLQTMRATHPATGSTRRS